MKLSQQAMANAEALSKQFLENPDEAAFDVIGTLETLKAENAALKIKCNRLRVALEDIEEASVDPWAKIAADRVLKEVQP